MDWSANYDAVRDRVLLDLLAEHGSLLGEPYTRQLDGKLRELRFHLQGRAVPVTYWIAPGRRVVLLTFSPRPGCGRPGRSTGRGALQRCLAEEHTVDEDGEERVGCRSGPTGRICVAGGWPSPAHRRPRRWLWLAFELGRRVRELRVHQEMRQTELARRAGMTQPAVARFEAGGTVPTLPVLGHLARALRSAI